MPACSHAPAGGSGGRHRPTIGPAGQRRADGWTARADAGPADTLGDMHPIAVAAGGAVGTLLRLLLTSGGSLGAEWDPRISVVNVVGAFLLGLLARLPVRPRLRSMLASGGLGALTSFSALSIALVD